jgi:hypothetical protein
LLLNERFKDETNQQASRLRSGGCAGESAVVHEWLEKLRRKPAPELNVVQDVALAAEALALG